MKLTLLVGAGFSLDANRYLDRAAHPTAFPYPLVGDLAKACFDSTYDLNTGVEAAFQSAIDKHDHGPVRQLIESLQSADYFIGRQVAEDVGSAYSALIDRFPNLVVLSFNYDSLLEVILHRRGLWTPVDGFGVPCEADVNPVYIRAPTPPSSSSVIVIHLHGSICLYPRNFETYKKPGDKTTWLREREKLICRFDPDALAHLFIPYRSGAAGSDYMLPEERVIAPVPNKAEGLKERFIQESYRRASSELEMTDLLVAVGYRFAECDRSSYDPILRQLEGSAGKKLYVVSPDTDATAGQLRPIYPRLDVETFRGTFADWAAAGFPIPASR